jgi:hypothetical protein
LVKCCIADLIPRHVLSRDPSTTAVQVTPVDTGL